MPKILIISENSNTNKKLLNLLNEVGHEALLISAEEALHNEEPQNINTADIALIDTACRQFDIRNACKILKAENQVNEIQMILLVPQNSSPDEVFAPADGYITMPFNDSILIATVNAHLRIKELQKTNIELKKLEKLKSEFISIVSHELRTPLTSIKNSLDIMLSGKTGEITGVQDNFLSIAKRNVDRLSGIINDLLDLSKIEAGKIDFRFNPMNIADCIEFIKSTFQSLADKKNIKLILNTSPDLPQVFGDINKIEQVLSNLVSNAIKFTPENGEIKISAEQVSADSIDISLLSRESSFSGISHRNILKGNYLKVSVEDTGIGIQEADIPKVFDKFQQIESSLSREVGGTGLGLPIARQLIEAHRGKIWLESDVHKGSKFSFILPVMMHHNTFLLELDNALQHSKYSHSGLVLVLLVEKIDHSENESVTNSIIKDIAEGKINIIRKGDAYKFYVQENKMQIILSNGDKLSADNLIEHLKEHLTNNKAEYSSHNLSLGISIYPDDAITSEELIGQAEKSLFYSYKTDKKGKIK